MDIRVIPWWMSNDQVEWTSIIMGWMAMVLIVILLAYLAWALVLNPLYDHLKHFSFKCRPFAACCRHGRCWTHSRWL